MVKVTHKNISKILSVLVIFILLSSVLFPAVSSTGIFTRNEKETNNDIVSKKIFNRQTIGEKIKDRLDQTRENILERLNTLKDRDSAKETNTPNGKSIGMSSGNSLLTSLRSIVGLKTSTTSLNFHTNYKGHEKDTPLKLFGTTKVDVDGDGDDDINTRLLLYPSIVRPFALAINFRLKIERLSGFGDKNADFEAYAEFYLPGSVITQNKDDRVRFGYHSENGEEIPGNCIVTYRFLPFLFFKQKPETRIAIDPRGSAGTGKLDLIFSLADMNNSKMKSQMSLDVTYDPIVKSELSIGNTDDLEGKNLKIVSSGKSDVSLYLSFEKEDGTSSGCGAYIENLPKDVEFEYKIKIKPLTEGTRIEYDRVSSTHVDVMLFIKNGPFQQFFGTSANFYIKYIPNHFSFTSDLLGLQGGMEIDTFDESIDEMGWCDDLFNPKQWLYFADLPTEGEFNWDFRLDGGLKMYVDTMGVSVNARAIGQKGGVLDISVEPKTNIDCTVDWDILNGGYFRVNRNPQEIDFSVDFTGPIVDELHISGTLPRFVNDIPFEVNFGSLLQGNPSTGVEVKTGINIEIDELYLLINEHYGEDVIIHDFELNITDVSFTIGAAGEIEDGSFSIYPIFPQLIEDIEDLINGEIDVGPYFDSPYAKVSIASYCSLTVGSCNLNLDIEEIPLPSINITLPDTYEVSGVVTIAGAATPGDPSRPIQYVKVKIDDGDWKSATGTTSWSYTWDTTAVNDGYHIIYACCYDGTYYANASKGVFVNNYADPTVEITYPSSGDEFTEPGIITILGTASPGDFPLDYVNISISSWGSGTATGLEEWSYEWDITNVKNGEYNIKATVYDIEGQEGTFSVNVTINKGPMYNPPTVRIDHPTLHFIVSDIVTIDGSAAPGYHERDVQNVQVKLSPMRGFNPEYNWINVTDHNSDWSYWSYDWDTSSIPAGLYTIYARSFDGTYYSDNASVKVVVWNLETDIIDKKVTFELSRGRSTNIDISDFNFNLRYLKTVDDEIRNEFAASFDRFTWGTSDDSASVYFCWDSENKSIDILMDRFGRTLTVENPKISFSFPSFSLDGFVRLDYLYFTGNSNENCEFSAQWLQEDGPDISFSIELYLSYDVELYGLYGRLNNWSGGLPELHLVGEVSFTLGLELSINDVTWNIAQDGRWGWIKIGGNGHVYLCIDMEFINGEKEYIIAGELLFASGDESFNISWDLRNENVEFSAIGSLILEIRECHIKIADIFELSIPEISSPDSNGCTIELNVDKNGGYIKSESSRFKSTSTNLDLNITLSAHEDILEFIEFPLFEGGHIDTPAVFNFNLAGSIEFNRELNSEKNGLLEVSWDGYLLPNNPDLAPFENFYINFETDADVEKQLTINNFTFGGSTYIQDEPIGLHVSFLKLEIKVDKDKGFNFELNLVNNTDNKKDFNLFIGGASSTVEKELTILGFNLGAHYSSLVSFNWQFGRYWVKSTRSTQIFGQIHTSQGLSEITNNTPISGSLFFKTECGKQVEYEQGFFGVSFNALNASFGFNMGGTYQKSHYGGMELLLSVSNLKFIDPTQAHVSLSLDVYGSHSFSGTNMDHTISIIGGGIFVKFEKTTTSVVSSCSGHFSLDVVFSGGNLGVNIYAGGNGFANINNRVVSRLVTINGASVLDQKVTFSGNFNFNLNGAGSLYLGGCTSGRLVFNGGFIVQDLSIQYEGNNIEIAPLVTCDYLKLLGTYLYVDVTKGSSYTIADVVFDCDLIDINNFVIQATLAPTEPYFKIVNLDLSAGASIHFKGYKNKYYILDLDTYRQSTIDFEIEFLGLNLGTTKCIYKQGSGMTDFYAKIDLVNEYAVADLDHQVSFDHFIIEADDINFKITTGNQFYGDLRLDWEGDIENKRPTMLKLSTQEGIHGSFGDCEVYRTNGEIFTIRSYSAGFNGPSSIEAELTWSGSTLNYAHVICTDISFYANVVNFLGMLKFNSLLELDGEFIFDRTQENVYIASQGSYDLDFEYGGFVMHRVKSKSVIFDGSLEVDWTDGVLIDLQVNSFSSITNLEVERPLVHKIQAQDLEIQSSSATLQFNDANNFELNIVADIHIGYFLYKDLALGKEKAKIINLDIDGDFTFKKTGPKIFFMESQSGFSITSSDTLIKVDGHEFSVGFEVLGDLEVDFGQEGGHDRVRFESNSGIDIALDLSCEGFTLDSDFDVSSGWFKMLWELNGDYDGFIGIYSSHITGTGTIIAMYNNYGVKATMTSYFEASFGVQWDPWPHNNPIGPGYWYIFEGSYVDGDIKMDFYNTKKWYNIIPTCLDPIADAGGPYSGLEDQLLEVSGEGSTSPDGGPLEYRWNFGDSLSWTTWTTSYIGQHVYSDAGTYTVKLQVRDVGDILPQDEDTTTATISDVNHPPNKPETPSGGPSGEGNVGTSYEFNTITTDPDNDDVRYGWDWDGDYVVDQWTDYYFSGSRVWASHIWYSPGTYYVRVKAEDVYGEQSSFSNHKTVIISNSGSPEWVTPNAHYQSDGWINEANARDDNEATYAESDPPYHNGLVWEWTDFIELTITPNIDCSKIRYNADYHSSYIRKIDVDVYRTDINDWHAVYNGPFTDSDFQEKSLGGTYPVSKARIRFEIKGCLGGTTAEFYEFDFWKIP